MGYVANLEGHHVTRRGSPTGGFRGEVPHPLPANIRDLGGIDPNAHAAPSDCHKHRATGIFLLQRKLC